VVALAIVLQTLSAHGDVVTAESEGVRATLYAPDWVWKGQNLNFLIVFQNSTSREHRPSVEVRMPNQIFGDFPQAAHVAESVRVAPYARTRFAFANIGSSDAKIGTTYEFSVRVQGLRPIDSTSYLHMELPAQVKVIRGAVVAEGIWAAILPAAVAAAWCVVLALYFRRHAAHGAWKTPSPTVWEFDRGA
jgi:hypothetical protein